MSDAPAPKRSFLRRLARFGVRAGLVLAVVLAVGFFAVTQPIDRSPILGTEVAKATDAALDAESAALAARPVERGRLRVGWASRTITPPLGTPTLGYGARFGRGIQGVADDVYVHALAVAAGDGAPLVIVTADLCLWMPSLSDRIAAGLTPQVPRERLYFGATHTHNGPSGFVGGAVIQRVMGARNPAVCDLIVAGAIEAAKAAVADLRPGTLRESGAAVPELIENRMRPSGGEAVDDGMYVAEFRQSLSNKRFALVNYAAHATAINPLLLQASADYPGAMRRALIEEGFDGAAFLAGATGQAGPVLDGKSAHASDTGAAYEVGRRLAKRVLGALEEAPLAGREEAAISIFRSRVTLPMFQMPVWGRALKPGVVTWAVGAEAPATAFVHGVRLGDTILIGHSFEFSSVITRGLKEGARATGGPRLVVTSFNGHHNLYVVPDATYSDGVYESGMTLFGPHLGSYLEKVTERVYSALSSKL